ncbi:hypothetical protein J5X98_07475 [Leptothermofonsia sichuanensis E412]|uniref:hypothetical protein n=1 Tax=Leptothermofonsia sichuanensis TaxID=2917832 RepID=UPI001CA656BD|nr:hypothetical protein [Leptothermofonsia sichuanensis]QZZ22219.1 hypothetical protein J5X98_07475 [Leptothermofonsia sichuanensis E412]
MKFIIPVASAGCKSATGKGSSAPSLVTPHGLGQPSDRWFCQDSGKWYPWSNRSRSASDVVLSLLIAPGVGKPDLPVRQSG